MKSHNFLPYLITPLLAITLLSTSCNSEEPSDIQGSWQLKEIVTNCDEANISAVHTLIESDENCCVQTVTTETTGATELTLTSFLCQTINLEASGTGSITTDDMTEIETKPINYTINDNVLVLCDTDDNCVIYQVEADRIFFDVDLPTISGNPCTRVFSYFR